MSTNPTGPARSTWTTQTIRASDLTGTDTVLIEGVWREVLDVWTGDDDPAAQFGEDNPTTLAILAKTDWSTPCWIAVRFVDEDRSNDMESMDSLHFFRLRDLVEVQKEIPPTHFTTRVPNQRTTE
ncbi:hypothetical protein [Streptomyces griseus]|uniref:hypothetical protein n=1 Tax=Streptomyces griseus TaxID=1911 RepID=UPI000A371C20|nr:hypothetical protein [Streptomyces fimicarius]